jgi:hypothetical protein
MCEDDVAVYGYERARADQSYVHTNLYENISTKLIYRLIIVLSHITGLLE